MVTEIVDLDLGSNSSFKIITMEGDIRSRFIEFHLSYNGEVFNLHNKSVKCRYVNGRTTEEVNLVINDRVNGVCTLEIPYRITSSAQNGKCELVISQSGEILSTIPFSVEVVKSLIERAPVESSSEFGALNDALWKIDGVDAELNNINSRLDTIAVNVEYFRFLVENDDWTKAIRKAIEKAGVGGSIIFNKDTIYTITGQLDFLKNQCIKGNGATLKRANESKAQITVSATSSSTTLTFSSVPSDWEVGDMMHIFVGQSMADSSNPRKIKSISGNTITLESSIGKLIGESNETSTYPVGTWVRKTYTMISSQQYPVPYPVKIDNLIIDGNRNNNNSNYYWYCNSGVSVYGYGTEIKDCKFYSMPNECIITHGANIIDCYAEGLNGSFVHLSSPPKSLGEEFMGTSIAFNIVKRSNAIDPTITGHSKAVIEQSWNAGKTTIIGNQFEGCGYGVCFDLLQQTLDNEKAYYSEFIIVGNTFKKYSKISDAINNNITWELNNKIVTNNVFDSCGSNDFSNLKTKNCIFENNTLSGGTTVTGYSKNIKEIYGDSYSQIILTAGASSLSLMHMSNGATYVQKGSTQYFYVDSSGKFILNKDTMILDDILGVHSIKKYNKMIENSVWTSNPSLSYLNTQYRLLPIGSEVYFSQNTPPTLYKKVANDKWLKLSTEVVS